MSDFDGNDTFELKRRDQILLQCLKEISCAFDKVQTAIADNEPYSIHYNINKLDKSIDDLESHLIQEGDS